MRSDPLRAVLETAHEAFVSMDAGGFITDWNPAAEATFGWSREEAVGRVLADVIVPERHRGAHLDGLARYLATGDAPVLGKRLELEGLHREGHEFPVELTISATYEHGGPTFHAFLHDITDRLRTAQYLSTQHAVTVALSEAETADDAVRLLLRALGEGMGWEAGAYWTPDGNGSLRCREMWISPGLAIPAFERRTRELTLAVGVGLPGRVWADGRPAFIPNVAEDPNFPRAQIASEVGLHAATGLPVLDGKQVRGVIEFFSRAIRHREHELLEMMSTLSARISRTIVLLGEREDALAKLERLAATDELTKLANRRGWNDGLRRELSRSRRAGDPLCVAMLDIDRFKAFNDELGHAAGDDVLRQTADAWRALVRPSDVLARYGGEEFALAFSAQPVEVAIAVVERLRRATPMDITCSAGLASWDGAETADELVGRADRALYDAKRAGRDRTVVADS